MWYFMKNIFRKYLKNILTLLQLVYFCFELEGTYVNLLIWWFENDWLLPLGAIVIQMKFDVIMDLLNGSN